MTRARLGDEHVHTPEGNEGRTEDIKLVSRPPWSRGMSQRPPQPPCTHLPCGSTSVHTSSPQGLSMALNGGKQKYREYVTVYCAKKQISNDKTILQQYVDTAGHVPSGLCQCSGRLRNIDRAAYLGEYTAFNVYQ